MYPIFGQFFILSSFGSSEHRARARQTECSPKPQPQPRAPDKAAPSESYNNQLQLNEWPPVITFAARTLESSRALPRTGRHERLVGLARVSYTCARTWIVVVAGAVKWLPGGGGQTSSATCVSSARGDIFLDEVVYFWPNKPSSRND